MTCANDLLTATVISVAPTTSKQSSVLLQPQLPHHSKDAVLWMEMLIALSITL